VDIKSGLVLDLPPFNQRVAETLCEADIPNGSLLKTVLIVNS
jgi:hypothetical protein